MDISAVLETATPEQIMAELDKQYNASLSQQIDLGRKEHLINYIEMNEIALQNMKDNGHLLYQKHLAYWQKELAVQQKFLDNLAIVHQELLNSTSDGTQYKLNSLANLSTTCRSRLFGAEQEIADIDEQSWIADQITYIENRINKCKKQLDNML